jgi:hypothetical protein
MMPDWSQMSIRVGGHYDTGDDDPADGTNTQYDPLNYSLHDNAGRVDFFKFGNLTFLRTGLAFHLLSDWYFGGEYFMFQKTKAGGRNFLERGLLVDDFSTGAMQFGSDKDLGQEVDAWVGKTFPSGVNIELTLGYLKPGQAMKTATYTTGGALVGMDDDIYNLSFDLGFFF